MTPEQERAVANARVRLGLEQELARLRDPGEVANLRLYVVGLTAGQWPTREVGVLRCWGVRRVVIAVARGSDVSVTLTSAWVATNMTLPEALAARKSLGGEGLVYEDDGA